MKCHLSWISVQHKTHIQTPCSLKDNTEQNKYVHTVINISTFAHLLFSIVTGVYICAYIYLSVYLYIYTHTHTHTYIDQKTWFNLVHILQYIVCMKSYHQIGTIKLPTCCMHCHSGMVCNIVQTFSYLTSKIPMIQLTTYARKIFFSFFDSYLDYFSCVQHFQEECAPLTLCISFISRL